jgi:uncharacterized repeat protein (TIGR01451 family)
MLLLPIATLWLLVASLVVQAADLPGTREGATFITPLPLTLPSTLTPSLALPCGSGEKHLPDVICLHGVVMSDDNNAPISGVQVTISYQDHTVTGTTFIHPGETEPTYGIDISPLQPEFLQPVTVTAAYGDLCTRRTVIAFPDFRTQTQELDLRLRNCAIAPLRSVLWGQVIDYATRRPVTGAIVTAEFPGDPQPVTTSPGGTGELGDTAPGYRFDISTSTPVTLTVEYQGDRDQKVFQLSSTIQNVDFVIGWRCEDLSAVPRGGGSGFGLPDLACFWGYGLLNGIPTAGMEVRLAFSDTVYTGMTSLFPGEDIPQFAIAAPVGALPSGAKMTATLSHQNLATTVIITAQLDASNSQQININLVNATGLTHEGNGNAPADILFFQDGDQRFMLTVGNGSGLLIWRWNPFNHRYEYLRRLTTVNGLKANPTGTLARDKAGRIWAGAYTGGLIRIDGNLLANPTTQRFLGIEDEAQIVEVITIDSCDNLWFNSDWTNSVSLVQNASAATTTLMRTIYTPEHGIPRNAAIRALTPMPDCSIWMGTDQGAAYLQFDSKTQTYSDRWEPKPITTTQEQVNPRVIDILVARNGEIWFATFDGISRKISTNDASGERWCIYTNSNGFLSSNYPGQLHEDNLGRIWVSHALVEVGIDYFDPSTVADEDQPCGSPNNWQHLSTNHGLLSDLVRVINTEPQTHDLYVGTQLGISVFDQVSNPLSSTQSYTVPQTLIFNRANDVTVLSNGQVIVATEAGISILDPSNGEWSSLAVSQSQSGNNVRCVTVIQQKVGSWPAGSVWLCTADGVYHLTLAPSLVVTSAFRITNGLIDNRVNDIVQDSQGELWVATESGVSRLTSTGAWVSYTTTSTQSLTGASWLPGNHVYDIEVVNDALWFGTDGGVGMYKPYCTDSTCFRTLTQTNTNGLMVNNVVHALKADANGRLFLGHGSACCNSVGQIVGGVSPPYDFTRNIWITTSNFVTTSTYMDVSDIVIDGNNEPWYSINGTSLGWGLMHYNQLLQQWEKFNQANGLPGIGIRGIDFDPFRHKLWVATTQGLGDFIIPQHQSDLDLSLQVPSFATEGQPLTFTALIQNRGAGAAGNTHFTLTLPPTLTYSSSNFPPSTLQPLAWDLLTVTAGSAVTVVINTNVALEVRKGTRLTARASVTTASPDAFPYNNSVRATVSVRNGVDVSIGLIAPPMVIGGQMANYQVFVENLGGLTATDVGVIANTSIAESDCVPGDMLPQSQFFCTLTLAVPEDAETLRVDVTATSNPPDSYPLNNHASLTLPVYQQTDTTPAIPEKLTLILVAPERLEGSSLLMPQLYKLAEDPSVDGLVLNVLDSVTVTQAYADWQNMRYSPQAANTVAAAIKAYVTPYITAKTKFLVIVGGDQSIPFYRIPDRSRERLSTWGQDSFSSYLLQNSHLAETFRQNMFLTDDFYAAPEATTVYSTQCRDCKLFVPRLASGRLVESAEEISATLDAFLNQKLGFIPTEAVVLANRALTFDLGEKQCDLMGMKPDCVLDGEKTDPLGLGRAIKLLYAAVHSNPQSQGALWLREDDTFYEQFQRVFAHTLLITIGCHAGLNLPNALDLVQMFLARGGAVIGSTAYAYASPANIAYSEALAEELTNQLTLATTATLGEALVHAKQRYVVERNGSLGHLGWFDPLDEKVLQPLTLYGLPMIPLDPRAINTFAEQTSVAHPMVAHASSAPHASLAYTFTFSYELVGSIEAGMYYTWSGGTKNGSLLSDPGQLLAQSGRPVQPALIFPLTVTAETGVPTDVILRTAQYRDDIDTFKPYFPRICAISEPCATGPALTPPPANDWDHQLPYVLGVITGTEILQSQASLNLVLGAYHGLNNVERRFEQLVLEVTYNKNGSFDQKAPQITHLAGYTQGEIITLRAQVDHRDRVAQVVGICDDGRGAYTSITLHLFGNGAWTGDCKGQVERFFVQVVDTNGRVIIKTTGNNNPWVVPLPDPAPSLDLYLPIISNGLDSIGSNDQDPVGLLDHLYLPMISN